MAFKIDLKKPRPTPAPKPAPSQKSSSLASATPSKPKTHQSFFADAIDEVGALDLQAADIRAKIAALQAELVPINEKWSKIKADLKEQLNLADPDEAFVELGSKFKVTIGPQAKNRSISNMHEARDLLGGELFMEIAKVNLTDLDKYLTEAQREKCITVTRGDRQMKLHPL